MGSGEHRISQNKNPTTAVIGFSRATITSDVYTIRTVNPAHHPFREGVQSTTGRATWLGWHESQPHSCGTAPDLHRLRLSVLPSGTKDTSAVIKHSCITLH